MKLYTWTAAPNPRRARIFVAEKGIDIEIVEAGDPQNPAILSDAFCEKFPHRRVPLLELDDGDWIGETAAICRYLEAIYPDRPLMGRNPKEIAMVEMWDRVAEWEAMMAAAEVFRNTSRAFAGRGLPGYKKAIAQIPDLAERGKTRLAMFYDKLDVQLAGREFITGDLFSLADITALCSIDFAGWRKLGIPEKCTNVARWHAAVSARPSAAVGRS